MRKRSSLSARIIPASLLVTAFLLGSSGFQAVYADAGDDSRIQALEIKYFFHDYPQESASQRLVRLENLVFGQTRPGSDSQRVARLDSMVHATVNSAQIADDTASSANVSAEAPSSASNVSAEAPAEAATSGTEQPYSSPSRADRTPVSKTAHTPAPISNKPPVSRTTQGPAPLPAKVPVSRTAQAPAPEPARSAGTRFANLHPAPSYDPTIASPAPRLAPARVLSEEMPNVAPRAVAVSSRDQGQPPDMSPAGAVRQVETAENVVFGKIYLDSLINRLTRLENRVFPQEHPLNAAPWPYRLQRLQSELGLSGNQSTNAAGRYY